MKTLVFATNNKHKLDEVKQITSGQFKIVSLEEIGCQDDIPETSDTMEGNALQKAWYIKDHYGYDCFADDSGLEVEALANAPGIYSARYAGPQRSSQDNMNKLLGELKDKNNRNARFRTVIVLILEGKEYVFEGIVPGTITEDKRGTDGFGYDPVFMPDGYDQTFAEMGDTLKNTISHRAKAVKKLQAFFETIE